MGCFYLQCLGAIELDTFMLIFLSLHLRSFGAFVQSYYYEGDFVLLLVDTVNKKRGFFSVHLGSGYTTTAENGHEHQEGFEFALEGYIKLIW